MLSIKGPVTLSCHQCRSGGPITAAAVTATEWTKPYTRERAAFPAPWTKVHKYWPSVARINDVHGDRNLVCACPPLSAYES